MLKVVICLSSTLPTACLPRNFIRLKTSKSRRLMRLDPPGDMPPAFHDFIGSYSGWQGKDRAVWRQRNGIVGCRIFPDLISMLSLQETDRKCSRSARPVLDIRKPDNFQNIKIILFVIFLRECSRRLSGSDALIEGMALEVSNALWSASGKTSSAHVRLCERLKTTVLPVSTMSIRQLLANATLHICGASNK